MSTDTKKSLREKAAKMIEEAIILKELNYVSNGKTASDINPIERMSHHAGLGLVILLSREGKLHELGCDWEAEMLEWTFFMEQLLVVIGKPGILDKLDERYRETASERIKLMHGFFESIYDTYTKEWMEWLTVTQFGNNQPKEELERTEEYYDFSNRTKQSNFFHSYEFERMKEMERRFPEVRNEI